RAVNAAFETMFGLERVATVAGLTIDGLVAAAFGDGAETAQRLHRALWSPEGAALERHPLEDGRVIEIVRKSTPHGTTVCVFTDATRQHRSEAALKRQGAHLVTILENISDGVCLVAADGTTIAYNTRLLAMYRIDPAGVEWGIPLVELVAACGDLEPLTPERRARELRRRVDFVRDPARRFTLRHLFTGETYEVAK
ncbi:MAG: PAS-domain containing protein, partial [Pseudomonadota bacterium]